ncbi:MAG: prephenate dehydratase [Clostridia bacterium]|nr:prephenate dehydratase [Clostridia bacterium]
MELTEIRKKIDEIDKNLVDLYKQRMLLCANIAEYKRENGMPILDTARERELLNKVADMSGREFEEYTRTLYSTILDISRSYQHKILGMTSELYQEISNALTNTPTLFPSRARVACQGIEGAYSQIASEKFFELPNITYFSNFNAVFSAIEKGLCEYGVLPIENTTAGSVKEVYELMRKHNFKIVRSVRVKVEHNLLAKSGTKLQDLKVVYSHEQAISQCGNFLATLPKGVKIIPVENTAVAAKMVAEECNAGAISSIYCAEQYGLNILARNIQDNGNNQTRFICISNKLEIYPGSNKTSITLVIPHKPGALYKILSRFNALGINLVKLESRPIPERNFEFLFYFDIEASVYSEKFAELMSELEKNCDDFTYLGTYSEIV